MTVCITGDVHHMSMETRDQEYMTETEVEAAIEYAEIAAEFDVPVTLFDQPGTMSLIGGWSFRGDTNQFEIPSQFLDQDAYSLIDASLVWKHMNGKYEVGIYGRNLTDQQYRTSGHQFVTPDGSASTLGLEGVANAFFGPPRTYTVTARVNF